MLLFCGSSRFWNSKAEDPTPPPVPEVLKCTQVRPYTSGFGHPTLCKSASLRLSKRASSSCYVAGQQKAGSPGVHCLCLRKEWLNRNSAVVGWWKSSWTCFCHPSPGLAVPVLGKQTIRMDFCFYPHNKILTVTSQSDTCIRNVCKES